MVVTNRFHQLRSYLTFRCAVRQRVPHERQLQACAQYVTLGGCLLQSLISTWCRPVAAIYSSAIL